jgi:hypothetical protein
MVATSKLDAPGFTLSEGTLTRDAGGSRTTFRYTAPAQRHFDGGFEVSVYLCMFDAHGRFVAKRSAESSRTVLANRATWVHEVETDKLSNAKSFAYEIQYRLDYRRKITAGELPTLPAEADGSDYWRWLSFDSRQLEDRAVKLDISLWARNSYLEITYSQAAKLATDSCRTEMEIDLLDADRNVMFTKNFSCGLNYGQPSFDDTSLSMDRKSLRTLRFFELRGRTEVRGLERLVIDAIP